MNTYEIIDNAIFRSNRQIAIENNAIRYQGALYKYGHNGIRYTKTGNCVKCRGYKPTGGKVGNKPSVKKQLALANNEKYFYSDKPCKKCGTSKRHSKTSVCVKCQKDYRKPKEHQYNLAKFKLTINDYNEMLKAQNFTCAICKGPEQRINPRTKQTKNLAVDHCHDTGKVRGLLCHNCNIGIGNLKHNPEFLRTAAIYCESIK